MPSEFYALLGVDSTATTTQIRVAHAAAIAQLNARRRAVEEEGGDLGSFTLQRTRLDEAWGVLSDPVRRRRYDAMLVWVHATRRPTDGAGIWGQVRGSLVHPAAATATRILRVTSHLTEIEELARPASEETDEPPTLVPHEDDHSVVEPASEAPTRSPPPRRHPWGLPQGARSALHTATPVAPRGRSHVPAGGGTPTLGHLPPPSPSAGASLRLVDGSPGSSDVLVLPTRTEPRPPHGLPDDELETLLATYGMSGAMLRAVRGRMGLTLRQVADHTRISERYLEAVEGELAEALPPPTFVRGYVRDVARMLHLDPEAVVAGYMQDFEA